MMATNNAPHYAPHNRAHHLDDRITLRDVIKDFCGMLAAGAFIAAVSIWAPYIAQHY